MKWSLRFGRIAGIGLYVHATFPLLLVWIAGHQYFIRHDWHDAVAGVVMIAILFAIVVLHELGHALAARRFGIATRDITLLPIGGVARLERIPEDPKQELLVALAGPAVNVCLAALFFAALITARELTDFAPPGVFLGELLPDLMWLNVALACFNLLPVFPMDGGRVLRALLALRLQYARATRIAATIGQGMALVFVFLGLASVFFGSRAFLSNPFLIVLGAFVWVAAGQESGMVQLRSTLGAVTVRHMMRTEFHCLAPSQPLSGAVGRLLSGWQQCFPVIEDGVPLGVATRPRLLDALAEHGYLGTVREAITKVYTVDSSESAETALPKLQAAPLETLLVLDGGEMVGMLTQGSVREYLAIRGALAPFDQQEIADREAA